MANANLQQLIEIIKEDGETKKVKIEIRKPKQSTINGIHFHSEEGTEPSTTTSF